MEGRRAPVLGAVLRHRRDDDAVGQSDAAKGKRRKEQAHQGKLRPRSTLIFSMLNSLPEQSIFLNTVESFVVSTVSGIATASTLLRASMPAIAAPAESTRTTLWTGYLS